ncbi:MAG: L-fucose/L-arabinose isomerase family protein [Promethearchaeia archaeon]
MKKEIKIGVVCLARKTFDFEAAREIYEGIQQDLKNIEAVEWKFAKELVIEIDDAQETANKFVKEQIDGLICISGTFALGHLILELNKALKIPILLWGLNELPYDGGRIRLNSVCGVNLNASNLYKAGIRDFHVVIGEKVDEDWLDAIRIIKALNEAHVGIIGYRAKGFFNLDVDELDLHKKLGILVDHYELSELFNQPIEKASIAERKEQIKSIFNISKIDDQQLHKVAELTAKFDSFLEKNELTSVAVRCWPEFADEFGISPCAAMSILQSEGKILTCEGDILGSVSMLAHQAMGGQTPYLADFSQVNFEEDFALLWHCGVAACNLWDGKFNRTLDTYFAGGRGVTAGFVMKSGDFSILRMDYSPPDEYRIFLQPGKGVPMEKKLSGTYLKAKFEEGVRAVLDKIIENGIAHHVSVVYGDYIKPLEIFAKIKDWKVIT